MNDQLDKNLEAAMIKACLLFSGKSSQKREDFFQKRLLADLFCNKFDTVESAMAHLKDKVPAYAFDREQVKSALTKLEKDGFVSFDDENHVRLSDKTREVGDNFVNEQRKSYENLVNDIVKDIESNISNLGNKAQVTQNIKNCLDYYIQTSCYKLLSVDDAGTYNDQTTLVQKASFNLQKKEELVNQIIFSIGSVINNPTDNQRKTLETLAQTQITIRLMGIDPMLQNFKRSTIAKKVFVVDTDVLLYLITDNGEKSQQYKSLLHQLLDCGCHIYIPEEVFTEVYDHAEAAKKMYHYVSPVLNNDLGKWAEHQIKNVLLESYYRLAAKSNEPMSWDTYIGNYFYPKEGIGYTEDVIKEKVGGHRNIHYGHLPYNSDIYDSTNEEDIKLREQLFDKAFQATLQTEKAATRDEEKNRSVARNDTKIFLTIKRLNDKEKNVNGEKRSQTDSQTKSRNDFLIHKYYVLTNTFRIYFCTKDLGIEDRPFCSPLALMAFMVEAGIIKRSELDVLSLFDNPFLAYVADQSWEDVKKMVEVGIDFKGKNIVRLRYDLQSYLQDLLTAEPGTESYKNAIDNVKQKGYNFKEPIEYARGLEKQIEEKNKEIEKMREQIKKQEAERGKEHHKNLLEKFQKTRKKHKR